MSSQQDIIKLHTLLRTYQWDDAIKRIQSHPHEATALDQSQHSSLLVHLCKTLLWSRRLPPSIVKSLVSASPGLALIADPATFETPLHIIFKYLYFSSSSSTLCKEIALNIIHECPECLLCTINTNGFLPLHTLFQSRGTSSTILQFEIEQEFLMNVVKPKPKTLLMTNQGGITPIEMLWCSYCVNDENECILSHRIAEKQYYNELNYINYDILMPKMKYTMQVWPCLIVMINIAYSYYNNIETPNNESEERNDEGCSSQSLFRPLHAFLGLTCTPTDMIDFALKVHKREANTIDTEGNTPLHIVTRYIRKEDNCHMIEKLLSIDPYTASVRNLSGCYPLFIAIENQLGWDDGLSHIFNAFSDVLEEVDPIYGFYPFQYAALHVLQNNETSSKTQLNTIYQLLKMGGIMLMNKKSNF